VVGDFVQIIFSSNQVDTVVSGDILKENLASAHLHGWVILQFRSVFAEFVTCSKFSVADVSSSVFVQPLLLIEFVQKILKIDAVDRNLTKPEYDKVSMLYPALIQNALCKSKLQMYVAF
jgi:hypothetical protein